MALQNPRGNVIHIVVNVSSRDPRYIMILAAQMHAVLFRESFFNIAVSPGTPEVCIGPKEGVNNPNLDISRY